MDGERGDRPEEGLVAELWDLAGLGLLLTAPVRDLGRDVAVHLARTGLERALEQPAVRGPVEQAARHAAARIAASLTDRLAGELAAAATGNPVAAAALGAAGRAADHPWSRAARRLALRNPLARATTANLVGLTERAAGTGLARAAAGATLEPVVDVVADVVLDVVLELGPELALEIAEEAARQTAADLAGTVRAGLAGLGSAAGELGPLPAAAADWTGGAARSEPVRRAARTAGEAAGAAERLGVPELTARGALGAAGWAARTDLGRALTAMAEEVVRTALRDLMRDIARESVRQAWTRAVAVLLDERPPPPSEPDTAPRIARLIADPAREAAAGLAVRVSFRLVPATVPRIAVSAARSTGARAFRRTS
ncbi:hypothetical protein [Actinocorallia populi]|uniref:hypothetical protein n=1 Tax=Actinocorallia populi TaxID=2079200 RepID=UPI000D093153|nr:hypothetical protein [Actinocorallia populi]